MARKPERNHGVYKDQVSSELKISESNMTIWTSKSSTSFTKTKVTKAESNITLIPIKKKFFKFFLKKKDA